MSFSTALSGLNAATADLNVKSNNIANVNTTGFKQSRAEFGDVFAVSAFGTTSKTAVGNGVVLQNVAQQFNQGNLEFTDNSLDLALSGEGFFALAPEFGSGEVIYTRAGEFNVNKDGYIVSNEGWFLRTFPVDAAGNIAATSMTATGPIQLPPSVGAPEPTTQLTIATNLPSNATPISTNAVALVQGTNTATTPITVTNFATDSASFDVDASTILLNADYGSINGVLAEINSQLPAGYSAALDSSDNLIITGPDENAPLVDNFNGDVDGGGGIVADFATGTANAGTAAAPGQIIPIDPTDPESFSFSTSATIFDSLGNEHVLTTYYQKIDATADDGGTPVGDNQWQSAVYVDGGDVVGGTAGTPLPLATNIRVSFTAGGRLDTVDPSPLEIAFDADGAGGLFEWTSGADSQVVNISLAGTTQNSGPFNVGALTVNGFPTGRLTGVDVSDDGLIRATFSNGQAVPIGKIALGNFANPQALNKIGNTAWRETTDSGPVIAGEASTGSFGQIQAGALETSNVDLTKELVGLITAQRNFQANSKAIETNNAITQTIINLR
ncbi:MAG: flagellar hook protein FlgE [Methylophaga sp.]|nr:flagellar hook protein FlgE [Methylophaga sp.]